MDQGSIMTGEPAAHQQPGPQQREPVKEVYVAMQYRYLPESDEREYQLLGVFSTPELARERTACMRSSGWHLQLARSDLDPDVVC